METHLKSIGRDALLPGGVIIAGGGASTPLIKNIAENVLKLPTQLAEVYFGSNTETRIKERSWAVACGLTIVGFNADDEQHLIGVRNGAFMALGGKSWKKTISRWISQFLP